MKSINSFIIHSWGTFIPCNIFRNIIVSHCFISGIFISKRCSENSYILNIEIFMYVRVFIFLPIVSYLEYFKLGSKLFCEKTEYCKHPKEYNFAFSNTEVLWTRLVRTRWTDTTKLLRRAWPVVGCGSSWSWGPAVEMQNSFRRLPAGFS